MDADGNLQYIYQITKTTYQDQVEQMKKHIEKWIEENPNYDASEHNHSVGEGQDKFDGDGHDIFYDLDMRESYKPRPQPPDVNPPKPQAQED